MSEIKEEEVRNMEKEFDEAFDEATEDNSQGTEEDENETKSEEDSEEESTETVEPDTEAKETPSEEPQVEPEKEIDWQAKAEALENELAKANHKMSSWEGRISKANEERKKAEEDLEKTRKANEEFEKRLEALEKKKKEHPEEEESDEDDPDIKQLMDDFPDLVGPIKRMTKRMATNIAEKMLSEKLKDFKVPETKEKEEKPPEPKEEENQGEKVAEAHFGSIQKVYPDFQQHVQSGAVLAFIQRHPEKDQPELMRIYERGTAPEVINLLDSFYKDKKAREQKKVKAAEAVGSHPTAPPAEKKSKNDFDSAWEDAMKEG